MSEGTNMRYVKDAGGRTWVLFRTNQSISACAGCQRPVRTGRYALTCPSCMSLFCEDCVRKGLYAEHQAGCE